MTKETVAYDKTGYFSNLVLDYLSGKEELRTFYHNPFTIEGFKAQLEEKKLGVTEREILSSVLTSQYEQLNQTELVKQNILSLKHENTFTVTTGHQLNLFTGPLYFLYKICSTINLSRKLKEAFPEKHFVPVYWMASEDHDFDEISFFNLFNQKHQIEKKYNGPVGRMKLEGIQGVFAQLDETLKGRTGLEKLVELFKECYHQHNTFTQAIHAFVNSLFGDYGLIVLDGDHPDLKGLFVNCMQRELVERQSEGYINESSEQLTSLGYKKQVNPRAINLFYMNDGFRERIVFEEGNYKVLNTDLQFTQNELQDLLQECPERFSPNAVMRPLYQEVILPNLAYIGGGGELAYWFQLKTNFEANKVSFPILMLRNSALIVDGGSKKKMDKLNLSTKDLFLAEHDLMKNYLAANTDNELSLTVELEELKELFDKVAQKAAEVDASLKGMVNAESQKSMKSIQNIEKRLEKAEKQKEEVAMNQISNLKQKLFPNESLQERHDNLIYAYMLLGSDTIDKLLDNLDPFEPEFAVLYI